MSNTLYESARSKLLTGWGTWDVTSVMSYFLLPEGRGLSLGIKEYQSGQVLKHALIGSLQPDAPTAPNQLWSLHFVHDACLNGTKLKILAVVERVHPRMPCARGPHQHQSTEGEIYPRLALCGPRRAQATVR